MICCVEQIRTFVEQTIMSATLTIQARLAGRQQSLLEDWSIPLSPDWAAGGGGLTLRDLITRVVLAEVQAFRRRQSEQRFLKVLTQQQIAQGLAGGRVVSGQRETPLQPVDEEQAVGAALQAFEDGLYLVVVDDVPQHRLDSEIHLGPGSRVTFIRLTMLAGGF